MTSLQILASVHRSNDLPSLNALQRRLCAIAKVSESAAKGAWINAAVADSDFHRALQLTRIILSKCTDCLFFDRSVGGFVFNKLFAPGISPLWCFFWNTITQPLSFQPHSFSISTPFHASAKLFSTSKRSSFRLTFELQTCSLRATCCHPQKKGLSSVRKFYPRTLFANYISKQLSVCKLHRPNSYVNSIRKIRL